MSNKEFTIELAALLLKHFKNTQTCIQTINVTWGVMSREQDNVIFGKLNLHMPELEIIEKS